MINVCLQILPFGFVTFHTVYDDIFSIDMQPDDFFDYYGFSRYAMELNELTPELKALLPPTDTRFRPDQRYIQSFIYSEKKCLLINGIMFSFFLVICLVGVFFFSIRLLEEGKVAEAGEKKDAVEEKQRERRKEMAKTGEEHVPRFFR